MGPAEEPEEYLAQHLRDALARDHRVSELGLDVVVRSGTLHVSGSVSTEERRAAVDVVAAEVASGRPVVNDTTVLRYTDETNVEVLP